MKSDSRKTKLPGGSARRRRSRPPTASSSALAGAVSVARSTRESTICVRPRTGSRSRDPVGEASNTTSAARASSALATIARTAVSVARRLSSHGDGGG